MSLIKKLAGETIIYGLGSILPRVLQLLVFLPYLTNKFNEDQGQYGIHSIMYSFAGLLMVLLTYRMETAFFRFGSEKGQMEKAYSSALTAVFLTTLFFVGFLYLFSTEIAQILTKPEDARYVKLFAFICGFDVLAAIPFARLRLEGKAIKFSLIKILAVAINIAAMLYLLEYLPNHGSGKESIFSYQDENRLGYVFLANLIASMLTLLCLFPELLKNTWRLDKDLFKKMFHYAWPLIIVGVAYIISQLSDRWLINKFSRGTIAENEIQVGLYAAAVKFAVIMQLFTQAFNYAAEPFFFKRANDKDAQQIYADVARAFTFVACFAFLSILFYIDILQNILGSNFRGGLIIVPILLLAYLFLGLYYNFSVWYKIKDKTKIGALISIVGALISVSANIILIPRIGIAGAAWAAFFTFGSMAAMGYFVGRKYYPVPYRMDKILGFVLLALCFYFFSGFLTDQFRLDFTPKILMNTGLLVLYTLIVWRWERRFFSRIWH